MSALAYGQPGPSGLGMIQGMQEMCNSYSGRMWNIAYRNGQIESYEFAGEYRGRTMIWVDQNDCETLYRAGSRIRPLQSHHSSFRVMVFADEYTQARGDYYGWNQMDMRVVQMGVDPGISDYQVRQNYAIKTFDINKVKEIKKICDTGADKRKKYNNNLRKLFWARRSKLNENR